MTTLTEERREKLLDIVKKLLALSSNNPNEHEAVLAAAKAQEILLNYNLSMTDVEVQDEGCVQLNLDLNSCKIPTWQAVLIVSVSKAFFCKAIRVGNGVYTIIGSIADTQVVKYTFDYLNQTIMRLSEIYVTNQIRHVHKKSLRYSYSIGIVRTLQNKLDLIEQERRQETSQGKTYNALVVIKDGLVNKYVKEHYPSLISRTLKTNYFDSSAYNQGKIDGANVAIHNGGLNQGSIKLLT